MTGSIRHQHIYSSGIGELIAKDIDDMMAGAVILATYPFDWWNRHAFIFTLYSV